MDLINWSLSTIDTIFSRRSLGSGEPTCPDGTSRPDIRGMHGRGGKSCVWRLFLWRTRGYLPFRHHDNRYSADWIRLWPGLSKNSEDGNSCQSLTRLPVWIEAVGRAVSNETETINRNMDAIMLKLTALRKLIISEIRMDRENKSCEDTQRFAPKDTTKF